MAQQGTFKKANYFLCVRVTNPDVHTKIEAALDWVLAKDAQYTDFCYTKEMLHVTLCELCLETEAEVQEAAEAVNTLRELLEEKLPESKLTFRGITTFFKKVMVADVEYGQDFGSFAGLITAKMKEAGVCVVEKHAYRPHMTIMKVSTMRARKAKVEDINPWLYVHLKDTHFGDQRVNSVYLCKMGYERRHDGFYKTPAEIVFRTEE